jgi:DNA polymerase-3 subunit gamma/tau
VEVRREKNKMNLQLSLKYRPKNFSDVVYHEEVKKVLANSILSGDVANAFLFYGDRGTGKTTIARIFAKALNCENMIDGFNPCNRCFSCNEINMSVHPDIFEIDAASKNTVDSVRDLIDGAKYLPIRSKYKIYILDEVHMFSNSAFNSLLKILEEPPSHVRFFLNTTEYHKIPKTVVSRCQRLNFKKIPNYVIAQQLKKVCGFENIEITDDALNALSFMSDGSMRDGLSLLDQVTILTKKNIKLHDVSSILGYQEDSEILIDLIIGVLECDAKLSLEIFGEIYQRNVSYDLFFEKILDIITNLIIVKVTGEIKYNDVFPNVQKSKIGSLLQSTDQNKLNALWDIFSNGYKLLKSGFYSNNLSLLNLTILRCCCVNFNSAQDLGEKFEVNSKTSSDSSEIKSDGQNNMTISDAKESVVHKNKDENQKENIIESPVIKEDLKDNKNFVHGDLVKILHQMNEFEMVSVSKDFIHIFNFDKYEILDTNRLPSKYLQFFLKILRQNTEQRWRIIISDDEDDKKGSDNSDLTSLTDIKIVENVSNNSNIEEFENVKGKFVNSNEFFRNFNKTFNVNINGVKVTK